MTALEPIQLPPRRWLRSFQREGCCYEAMLVHPDGTRLIAAQRDGSITVWRLGDGDLLAHLTSTLSERELDDARNLHLRLHPDGIRLYATVVIVDTSDVTFCWDLERYELRDTFDYPQVPQHFLEGDLAVTAHGLWLSLWELGSGQVRHRLFSEKRSWWLLDVRAAPSPAALVETSTALELWDLERRQLRWSLPGSVYGGPIPEGDAAPPVPRLGGAAFLPAGAGGDVLLSRPGALEVRSADDGALQRTISCESFGRLTVDHAGRIAVIAEHDASRWSGSGALLAVELESGAVCSRFAWPAAEPVELSEDGRFAVVRSADTRASAVWELATGRCLLRASDPLALVPARSAAAAGGSDGTGATPATSPEDGSDGAPATAITLEGTVLRQWRLGVDAVASQRPAPPQQRLEPRPILCPAGRVACTTTRDGKLLLARLGEDTPPVELAPRGYPHVLALEPDAHRLALGVGQRDTETIELWRGTAPPLRLHTFRSRSFPSCAAFEPSRRWLVSGHHDGSLHLWDTAARKRHVLVETGPAAVVALAVSPAGDRLVALTTDHVLRGLRLEDLHLLTRWTSELALDDLRWLDDDTIAASSDEGDVRLHWPR